MEGTDQSLPSQRVQLSSSLKNPPLPASPHTVGSHKWAKRAAPKQGGSLRCSGLSTASTLLDVLSSSRRGKKRSQHLFLLPNFDGRHSTRKNLFNEVASSHSSTEFLHLYKYRALKLSYEPNFPALRRLPTNSQWGSQTLSHLACEHRTPQEEKKFSWGSLPNKFILPVTCLCAHHQITFMCEFWPLLSPSLTA